MTLLESEYSLSQAITDAKNHEAVKRCLILRKGIEYGMKYFGVDIESALKGSFHQIMGDYLYQNNETALQYQKMFAEALYEAGIESDIEEYRDIFDIGVQLGYNLSFLTMLQKVMGVTEKAGMPQYREALVQDVYGNTYEVLVPAEIADGAAVDGSVGAGMVILPMEGEGDSETGDINLDNKPSAHSNKLQNFINSLYKGQGNPNQIGNGTTMDSIRYELETGNPVEGKFHSQKGQEFMNGINKLINSGDLDAHDEAIAKAIVEDIANALAGK